MPEIDNQRVYTYDTGTKFDLEFQVTTIGTELAGFTHADIAPMFAEAPENCYFDERWRLWLGDSKKYWGNFDTGELNPLANVEAMCFIYGSNEGGRHGRGSALFAMRHRGAVYGHGIGYYGNSYGIPTMDINIRALPLSSIRGYVDRFIKFAESRKIG
jgi:hypothetical protein